MSRFRRHCCHALALAVILFGFSLLPAGPAQASSEKARDHLKRAKVYLAAGDYRRALEASQREVNEAPSVESYVYLTYVYHAIDGYLDSLAKADRWVAVEHLYLNLATGGPQDLTDPPDVLARIAKEILQGSVQRQADISAAMATKLDKAAAERLWVQQAAWRKAKPDGWWEGVPGEWGW
ncbi:MAG: hypothetical protein FJ249_05875 [Nitrospira sp.]|nr:hypothetical protein [Nitrospira sp.]